MFSLLYALVHFLFKWAECTSCPILHPQKMVRVYFCYLTLTKTAAVRAFEALCIHFHCPFWVVPVEGVTTCIASASLNGSGHALFRCVPTWTLCQNECQSADAFDANKPTPKSTRRILVFRAVRFILAGPSAKRWSLTTSAVEIRGVRKH